MNGPPGNNVQALAFDAGNIRQPDDVYLQRLRRHDSARLRKQAEAKYVTERDTVMRKPMAMFLMLVVALVSFVPAQSQETQTEEKTTQTTTTTTTTPTVRTAAKKVVHHTRRRRRVRARRHTVRSYPPGTTIIRTTTRRAPRTRVHVIIP